MFHFGSLLKKNFRLWLLSQIENDLKKIAFLRNISVQIWVAIFAWILAHIAILVYSTQSPDFHYHFYGADSLYLPSLSRDLLINA